MPEENKDSSGCGIALIMVLIGGVVLFGRFVGICGFPK